MGHLKLCFFIIYINLLGALNCNFRQKANYFLAQAYSNTNRNCNRKLETSTAPTKAESRDPTYSQALNQNKIDRQGVKIQRVR